MPWLPIGECLLSENEMGSCRVAQEVGVTTTGRGQSTSAADGGLGGPSGENVVYRPVAVGRLAR